MILFLYQVYLYFSYQMFWNRTVALAAWQIRNKLKRQRSDAGASPVTTVTERLEGESPTHPTLFRYMASLHI